MGVRGLDDFVTLVDHASRVLAAHHVVEAQVHIGGVPDDVESLQYPARDGVDDLLGEDGEGAVLTHIGGVVAVLGVVHAQDDHAALAVEEEAPPAYGVERLLLIRVHGDKGRLLDAGIGGMRRSV